MTDRRQDSVLRIGEVRKRTGLSTSTINRREAKGIFPRRTPIGDNSVAWYLSEIEDWIADPASYRAAEESA